MSKPSSFLIFALGSICLLSYISTQASETYTGAPNSAETNIVIRGAGNGNPSVNFSDSVELLTASATARDNQQHLSKKISRSRALASADFDEDGVPDLISGHVASEGGILCFYRGNVDSLYPNSPEAKQRKAGGTFTDSAFLSPALLFEVAQVPDFLISGDFDADGHADVVVAARGDKALHLLPGDGRGRFGPASQAILPGAVTAITGGEINRADGLPDISVGIDGADGPKALVFEGPEGAFKAEPEIFSLQERASSIALGHLDKDFLADLAVATGKRVQIVRGRDRRLSWDRAARDKVPGAIIETHRFDFIVKSIIVGDFTGKREPSIALLSSNGAVYLSGGQLEGNRSEDIIQAQAVGEWPGTSELLCARLSGSSATDLLVVNKARRAMSILSRDSNAAINTPTPEKTASFEMEDEPVAILPMRLNGDALDDLVILQAGRPAPAIVKTQGVATFTVNSTGDNNDGVCDGIDCTLREAIAAANDNPGADNIFFDIPGAGVHTITVTSDLPEITDPVTIDGTTQPGFAGKPVIELNGNNVGILALVIKGGKSMVRGLAINRFGFTAIAMESAGNNVIEGNFIGTDANGVLALGNGQGIAMFLSSGNNRIGATTASGRNLISSNTGTNLLIGENGLEGNVVQGNFIGTDITGTMRLGENFINLTLVSSNNLIGGVTAGAANVISGGILGVNIRVSNTRFNRIQGNFIGTDVSGTVAIPNGDGILSNTPDSLIGGTTPAARNLISGNFDNGIVLFADAGTRNIVQGNFIGTDITGKTSLSNGESGIFISNPTLNLIGGTIPAARNLISGNTGGAVFILGSGASGNRVQGNFIGTDITGTAPLGNGQGVAVSDITGSNIIGGTEVGAGNVIAFNATSGVFIGRTSGNAILSNSIFSNSGLGIDLGIMGVTPNDACDPDSGSNNLQNFPVLTSASSSEILTSVQGTLNSNPNTTFLIQFFVNNSCDPSGFGEGQVFIGSATVTTDANCTAAFNVTLPVAVGSGQVITATATDPGNNTSEFSRCVQVNEAPPFDLCLRDESNGNILLVNSATGNYQFTDCNGITLNGAGSITRRGCVLTLQANNPQHRIMARIDTCLKSATGSIQVFSTGAVFTIVDRNTGNSACACST